MSQAKRALQRKQDERKQLMRRDQRVENATKAAETMQAFSNANRYSSDARKHRVSVQNR